MNARGAFQGTMILAKKAFWVAVVVCSMTAAYLGVGALRQPGVVRYGGSPADSVRKGAPVDPFASANRVNMIAFVVTASDCGWSNLPEAMDAIRNLRKNLRTTHGSSYAQITVIGVALDKDLDLGLQFLAKLGNGTPGGAFDQVMVGGSWLNEQVVRFVWREAITEALSPQIIVVERPVNTSQYLENSTISVQADRVVANPLGTRRIGEWISGGMPLTKSRAVSTAGDVAK